MTLHHVHLVDTVWVAAHQLAPGSSALSKIIAAADAEVDLPIYLDDDEYAELVSKVDDLDHCWPCLAPKLTP